VRLNVGAGGERLPGYVSVDVAKTEGLDVVHDLDVAPWPFEDNSVSEVRAWDVFEHVADPVTFMTEAWRVLEPGGLLHIRSPHWRHMSAYTDPTHRRFCTEHTWDYWVPGTLYHAQHNASYGGVSFAMQSIRFEDDGSELLVRLVKAVKRAPVAAA
jgi:ubiquinone/menaquinone biosynthesis C-methylase UbiE